MNNLSRSSVIGLVFIAIGAVLLLDNLQFISWRIRDYVFQWENILILVGAVLIVNRENVKAGGILIGLGIFFNLDNWFRVDVNLFDFWPLLLVFAGLSIISRHRNTNKYEEANRQEKGFDADRIDDTAIFGGGDRVVTTKSFKGGFLTAVFGGSNIDLTQAQLAEGKHVIEVFYMFGGSKIRVPQDWNVHVRVTGIFGGMADKRKMIDPNQDSSKELLIRGTAIFGGAEITN